MPAAAERVIERIRAGLIERHAGSERARDRVTCLVRPLTEHLAGISPEGWYARFAAQLMTEPQLWQPDLAELGEMPMLRRAGEALHACLPGLSPAVRAERDTMARILIVHVRAERERRQPADRARVEAGLVDASGGLYQAPGSQR